LDSIPAGTYTLRVNATKAGSEPFNQQPVAQGSVEVTVPENPSPFTPIAVGEVVLKPSPAPTTSQRPNTVITR
jgi:hypothetical protein